MVDPGRPGARAIDARPSPDARLLRRVRWRLLAWSGGSTLVAMFMLGIAIYVTVAASLAAASTAQLMERAALLANANVPPTGVSAFGTLLARDSAQPGVVFGGEASGTLAMIIPPDWTPDSETTLAAPSSTPGSGRILPPSGGGTLAISLSAVDETGVEEARRGEMPVRTMTLAGTAVRVLSKGATFEGARYVIQVVGDRSAEERTLQVLLFVLVGGGVLVVALGLGVGYVYSGRALVPIRESLRRQRDFAADASHELRTPLAVVRGSVEHLLSHPTAPVVSVGQALADIDAETTRLTGLVDDLLLLARTDSGALDIERDPCDLAEAAFEGVSSLTALAAARDVRLELDVEPAPLDGDPARLRQLVTILVDNAIRHSPDAARVLVRVRYAGPTAFLEVEDEGPGIRSADLPRIFDRFYRAPDAPPGGTGLGLAIASWIVARHGGTITAENLPGRGARFRVRLPAR